MQIVNRKQNTANSKQRIVDSKQFTENSRQETVNRKRGFTLLETLFAIFILVLAITGPMVFAQSGLKASFQSRDQVTAFFLAQDAIETIKNIRDDNGLDGDQWLRAILGNGACAGGTTPCMIDTVQTNPSELGTADCTVSCAPLNINGNQYTHETSAGDESRFTRTIYLNLVNNDELEIIVEVAWDSTVSPDGSRIVVQENIYNWIPTSN